MSGLCSQCNIAVCSSKTCPYGDDITKEEVKDAKISIKDKCKRLKERKQNVKHTFKVPSWILHLLDFYKSDINNALGENSLENGKLMFHFSRGEVSVNKKIIATNANPSLFKKHHFRVILGNGKVTGLKF